MKASTSFPPTNASFSFQRDATSHIAATPSAIFDVLNDHDRLTAHMRKPSLMMAGGVMTVETDSHRGQALGSVIRMRGRVLGIPLHLEEVVVLYESPFRKTWETVGEPQLLLIGKYRMGFELTPQNGRTRLRVWIAYDLPSRIPLRWLGWLFAAPYADWCVRRMVNDSAQAFVQKSST
jgi:hypothetical protein